MSKANIIGKRPLLGITYDPETQRGLALRLRSRLMNVNILLIFFSLLIATATSDRHSSSSIHKQQYSSSSSQLPAPAPPPSLVEQKSEECEETNRPYAAMVSESDAYRGQKERLTCVDRAMIEDMYVRKKRFHLLSENSDRETFERLRTRAPTGGSMGLYHDYNEMTAFLEAIRAMHPEIARLYSLGKTLGHRDIWAMQLTNNPHLISPGRPRVKFVANIHGNEAVGRELLLHFVQDLVTRYGFRERRIMQLLDTTEVWVVPAINPDGFENGVRTNVADKDLNRDYPDQFTGSLRCLQPETRALIDWTLGGTPFALSLAIHGGELVVNYPFDGNADFKSGQESLCQDNAEFQALALTYASNHPDMASSRRFPPHGITNGAAWYVLNGGSQDWNYLEGGTMEVTAEVSMRKFPEDTELAGLWIKNRESLLRFAEQVHEHGVWGYILDTDSGGPVRNARVYIAERPRGLHSRVDQNYGAYWRFLLEGRYTLVASAEGYESQSKVVLVPRMETRRIDFSLKKYDSFSDNDDVRQLASGGGIPHVCV